MQSVWKGTISFGLVSIPVRLFSATEEKSIGFRQVHEADGGRIRYRRVCSVDGAEVPYSDIGKGYELPDGDLVVLTDDDFASLPLPSTRSVDVLQFVDDAEIDPVALDRAYLCEPTGDAKPYVLLRDALESAGRSAVVKVALRQRERLAVLRPRGGVLVLHTMLWPDEIRTPHFGFLDSDVTPRPQETAMAQSYIEALSGELEPEQYVDEYRGALEEIVQAKVAGREVVETPEEPQETGTVVDLMEALRRSVAAAQQGRQPAEGSSTEAPEPVEPADADEVRADEAPASAKEPTARKTAARKTPARKTPAAKKTPAARKTPAKTTGTPAAEKAPAKKAPAKASAKAADAAPRRQARKSA